MTATMLERPAIGTLTDAIRELLEAHGVPCGDLRVTEVTQGGLFAGVTVQAYERPAGLPAPDPAAAEQIERAAVATLLRLVGDQMEAAA